MSTDASSPSERSPLLIRSTSPPQVLQGESHRNIDEDILSRAEPQQDIDQGANLLSKPSLKVILPAVSIGIFLSAADQTIIVASYGIIGSDLHALNLTSFIATAYFLTLTSFQPLYGKLSDIFGRKLCLLWAYLIFGMGSMFCGLAQNIYQLIAARVFQGIGGGGMTTMVSILLNDIVPLKDRGLWQGVTNIIYSAGAASGAPLGGLLADFVSWRFAFLVQVPLCTLAFLAVFLFLKLPQSEEQAKPQLTSNQNGPSDSETGQRLNFRHKNGSRLWRNSLKRIDFPGASTLVIAETCLIFGLDRGSNDTWTSPYCYAPIAVSLFIFFPAFLVIESKIARLRTPNDTTTTSPVDDVSGSGWSANIEAFAPPDLIFSPELLPAYLANFFSFGSWVACLYFLPLYYQAVLSFNATQSSVRLIPSVTFGVLGSLCGGYIMSRTGRYYVLTVSAYTLLMLGYVPVLLFSGFLAKSWLLITLGTLMCAFGNGTGVTTTLIALISNSDPAQQAVVTACSYLFRSMGSVIGISLSATAVQTSLRLHLKRNLKSAEDADAIQRGVRQSLAYLDKLDPQTREIVRTAYEQACHAGFTVMAVLALGAVISASMIREKKLM